MSKIVFYLAVGACVLLVISCKNKSEGAAANDAERTYITENKMNDSNSFGKEYAQAWCSQKPKKVAAFFAPNGSLTVNDGAPAVGTEEIAKVAKGFMDAFPDIVVIMDSLVAKRNKTQFYWTLIGTNTGPGGTGNKVKISGFEEWIINEDGLIQESKGHFDSEEYNRQLHEGVNE
jgi:hypothetical protein